MNEPAHRGVIGRFNRFRIGRLIQQADRANRAGDWGRAEQLYADVLARQPQMSPIRVQYGHALKEQGFLHRAVEAYREAAAHANDADPWLQLGHALNLLDRPQKARAAFTAALRVDPAAPGAADELARLAMQPDTPGDGPHARLLERYELTPHLLAIFDPAFYAGATHPAPDLSTLLSDFGATGVNGLRAVNGRDAFDPDFYRRAYRAEMRLSPDRAYRHWLNIGLRRGWSANRAAWFRRAAGVAGRALDATLWGRADALFVSAPDPSSGDPFDVLLQGPHFSGDRDAEVLSILVEGLSGEHRHAVAVALAEKLAARWPDLAVVHRARARSLLAAGSPAAVEVAMRPLARCKWIGSDFACLASAQEAGGDREAALNTLAEGLRAVPADATLRQRFDRFADGFIQAAWSAAEARAMADDKPETARADLAAALDAVIRAVPDGPPLPPSPIVSVAIVGAAHPPQCRFYRVEQKLDQLRAAGYDVAFYDERTDVPQFLAEMIRFQAVIFYRVPAHALVIDAILRARRLGLVTIYEIDDLLFDGAHHPGDLASYGGGLDRTAHVGLQIAAPMYAQAMRLCDVGLASTPVLAEAMRDHVRSGTAVVHRNALPHASPATTERIDRQACGERVRVLYGTGTVAHRTDAVTLIEPALVHLVQRHGHRVDIVLVGHAPRSAALRNLGDRIAVRPAMPRDDYRDLLATADIVLAPLLPSLATDAKSEVKWLEAAEVGVPTVASATATYREVIDDGVTGFLCSTPEDWTATLDRLVDDAGLRRAVGRNAQAQARYAYSPDTAVRSIKRILDDLTPAATAARPRLIIVNTFYPPQLHGGATRVVHDNVRDLATRHGDRFDIAVFTSVEGGDAYRVRNDTVEGIRVTGVTSPGSTDEMAVADAAMERIFAAYLDAVRPALVHFHCIQRLTASVIEAARAKGVRYLVTAHDEWWTAVTPFPLRADRGTSEGGDRRALLRPALAQAEAVLAVSATFAAQLAADGVPNVRCLPNGVSANLRGSRQPGAAGRVRVGYLGGLYPHKGWLLVRAAFAARSFIHLDLVVIDHGLRPGETRHERWGGTPVEIAPKCDPTKIADLYGRLDVLIAPSVWPESFGLVTREALRCGCWVVASNRGAIGADVVPGINGVRIDVEGPDDLIATLAAIDADPGRFSRSPPETPLRTSRDQADDLATLYRSILDRAPATPSREER